MSRRRLLLPLAAGAIALAVPAPAAATSANTYVDDSGADTLPAPVEGEPNVPNDCSDAAKPCQTIQLALDNTSMGGTAQLSAGIYRQQAVISGGQKLIGTGRATQITSADPPDLPYDCTGAALKVETMPAEIRRLEIGTTCTDQTGIDIQAPGSLVSRVRLTNFNTAVSVSGFSMADDPAIVLENTVIDTGGIGVAAGTLAKVRGANLTILRANPAFSLTGAELTLDSSVVTEANAIVADGASSCAITYSPQPGPLASCGALSPIASPGFDPSDPDGYHLDEDSPLVDAGNPGPLADPGAVDIDGDPRAIDGRFDCELVEVRDIGADEHVPSVYSEPDCPEHPTRLNKTSAKTRSRQMYLGLVGPIGGNYTLCVTGPMRKECRGFTASRSKRVFRSTISWGDAFGTQGPGRYVARWLKPGKNTAIGRARAFSWGVCPPRNQTMDGVWLPRRLIVKHPCKTISGTVARTPYYSSNDNDIHVGFNGNHPRRIEILDRDHGHLARTGKYNRGKGPADPRRGQRVRATGVYVCDTFHGPVGDWELHPPFRLQILRGRKVVSNRISGPQYPGTPKVKLRPKGRFHCA